MIQKNGLLPPEAAPVQDSDALLTAASPIFDAKKIVNKVTDTAATLDRLYHGDGIGRLVHRML
jgi:hypothetical protein